jgi:hypothetical protein
MRPADLAGPARATLRDNLIRRLRDQPDVANVATVASVPLVGNWWRNVYFTERDGVKRVMGRFNRVSAGYFDTVSTPLVQGRDFDPAIDTPGSPRVAIVNQAFVRTHLAGVNPIGVEFRPEGARGGEPGTTTFHIVGIAGDTKHGSLREPFDPIRLRRRTAVGRALTVPEHFHPAACGRRRRHAVRTNRDHASQQPVGVSLPRCRAGCARVDRPGSADGAAVRRLRDPGSGAGHDRGLRRHGVLAGAAPK